MRVFQRMILIFVCTFSMLGIGQEGRAYPSPKGDVFHNQRNQMWISSRDEGSPGPNGFIATAIKITKTGLPQDPNIEATVWLFSKVVGTGNRKYDKRDTSDGLRGKITGLSCAVNQTGEGTPSRERETAKFEGGTIRYNGTNYSPVTVLLTGLTTRQRGNSAKNKRVICRIKFPANFPGGGAEGKRKLFNCDEPPVEDVLEEEPTAADPEPPYIE